MSSVSYNVETTPEKYFHQLLEILKVFPPFDKLRRRQREVFAEILYQFHLVKDYDWDVQEKLVFDYKTKEEIATKLDISKANLYNIYKELRQANLLTKDGINRKFKINYLGYSGITFKFRGVNKENV